VCVTGCEPTLRGGWKGPVAALGGARLTIYRARSALLDLESGDQAIDFCPTATRAQKFPWFTSFEHVDAQHLVSDQALQSPVLFLRLFLPFRIIDPHAPIPIPRPVGRRPGDTQVLAHIHQRRPFTQQPVGFPRHLNGLPGGSAPAP